MVAKGMALKAGYPRRQGPDVNPQRKISGGTQFTQLSHKRLSTDPNNYNEKAGEKKTVDNQAGTDLDESKLLKSGRKKHWMKRG